MDVAGQSLADTLRQAGLADPGLARDEHDLTLTALGARPAAQQQLDLLGAADELRQRAAMLGLEPALGRPVPPHAPDIRRRHDPLELLRPQSLAVEDPRHEPVGALADHDLT